MAKAVPVVVLIAQCSGLFVELEAVEVVAVVD